MIFLQAFPNWGAVRHEGNVWNRNYVKRKWGCSGKVALETCVYNHPFNDINLPISHWVVDGKRVEGMRKRIYPVALLNSSSVTAVGWNKTSSD